MMLAREAEEKANRRRFNVEQRELADLEAKVAAQGQFWSDRNLRHELAMKVDRACAKDELFKAHVSRNQWYTQYAIMYGNAATADKLDELIQVMKDK